MGVNYVHVSPLDSRQCNNHRLAIHRNLPKSNMLYKINTDSSTTYIHVQKNNAESNLFTMVVQLQNKNSFLSLEPVHIC